MPKKSAEKTTAKKRPPSDKTGGDSSTPPPASDDVKDPTTPDGDITKDSAKSKIDTNRVRKICI